MKLALRLLVFTLALASTGVVQAFACAHFAGGRDGCCAEETTGEEARHSETAPPDSCGICIACPHAVAQASPSVEVTRLASDAGEALDEHDGAPSAMDPADIFQPPEA